MSPWTKVQDNLVEHENGNWVWRVGENYEVWYMVNGVRRYGGTTGDQDTATKAAEQGISLIGKGLARY